MAGLTGLAQGSLGLRKHQNQQSERRKICVECLFSHLRGRNRCVGASQGQPSAQVALSLVVLSPNCGGLRKMPSMKAGPAAGVRNARRMRQPFGEGAGAVRASGQDGVDVDVEGEAKNIFVNPKVWITMIDAELERGNDKEAVLLAKNLRAFGKAKLVPQRIYTLEDLRLNKIDASKFLSPVDKTLGSVRRNLQVGLLAGSVVLWRTLELSALQVLGIVVVYLFLGTVDQVINGGGVESLVLDTIGRQLSSNYRDRVAQHEAGHFLIAYLMGILPKSYTLSSLDAFNRFGALNVQAGTTFVDYEFQAEVAAGKVSAGILDKVSCIGLSGVATEYLLYGVAEGGLTDIQQLDALMRGLGFTQRKADGQVRWAVLNTVTLLRRHKDAHMKLAAAMESGMSVADCFGVIETELAQAEYI